MLYFILKYLHIVGAAVLLGTGAGIAFFMLVSHLGGKPPVIAAVARIVVIADFIFTAMAVIVQPITGSLLVWQVGYSFWDGWIIWSIVLYVLMGALWLPVVWMQMRLRELQGPRQKARRFPMNIIAFFGFGLPLAFPLLPPSLPYCG